MQHFSFFLNLPQIPIWGRLHQSILSRKDESAQKSVILSLEEDLILQVQKGKTIRFKPSCSQTSMFDFFFFFKQIWMQPGSRILSPTQLQMLSADR